MPRPIRPHMPSADETDPIATSVPGAPGGGLTTMRGLRAITGRTGAASCIAMAPVEGGIAA